VGCGVVIEQPILNRWRIEDQSSAAAPVRAAGGETTTRSGEVEEVAERAGSRAAASFGAGGADGAGCGGVAAGLR
jgi:hypothetical protein